MTTSHQKELLKKVKGPIEVFCTLLCEKPFSSITPERQITKGTTAKHTKSNACTVVLNIRREKNKKVASIAQLNETKSLYI